MEGETGGIPDGATVPSVDNGQESRHSEVHKIRLVRSIVETRDPSASGADDLTIGRFLRARELDVNKASDMFLKYLSWRKTAIPNGLISPLEFPNEVAQNKVFLQGVDKKNRPILVVFAGRHKCYTGSLEQVKRLVVYCLEKICSRIPAGEERFMCIADLENWGYCNNDVRGYVAALSILQDFYPERLAKVFVIHAPTVFAAAWKVICPFIDSKTKQKIIFVPDKKLTSTLLADVDESQLPVVYGGRLPLIPIQDC